MSMSNLEKDLSDDDHSSSTAPPEMASESPTALPAGHQIGSNTIGPGLLQRNRTIPSAGVEANNFIHRHRNRHWKRYRTVQDPSIPSTQQHCSIPRGAPIAANADEILRAAMTDLKQKTADYADYEYDGMSPYFVSEEDELKRVRDEVVRLVDVVTNSDDPLQFSDGKLLGGATSAGYKTLSQLSKKVLHALHICNVDNEGVSLLYGNLDTKPESFKMSLGPLQQRRSPSTEGELSEAEAVTREEEQESQRKTSRALVDFITATLARLLTQIAHGPYWHNNMLGTLARCAAKVKLLLEDIEGNASISLRNAELALDTYMESQPKDQKPESDQDKLSAFRNTASRVRANQESDSHEATILLHCVDQQRSRAGIDPCLQYVLFALQYMKRSELPLTTYEVCTVVMETGFEGFKALLCQDRDHEFTSTSDLDNLNFAHSAFQILNDTVLALEKNKKNAQQQPPPTPPGALRTVIEWNYSNDVAKDHSGTTKGLQANQPQSSTLSTQKKELELSSMDEIVTIMVPLALTSPVVAARFKGFLDMFYLTGDVDEIVHPYAESPFDAFFRLYTNDYEATKSQRPDDVLGLSQAVKSGLFSRSSLMETRTKLLRDGSSNVDSASTARNSQKLKVLTELMATWVYDENSVIVKCGLYVWLVTIAAAILVLGGLALGLNLHSRIAGVDPFQLTSYTWVLGAFLVLICKSLMVQEWSWRDFLRGQVRCRSVSELQAVTGINEQLIMAKLLHDEKDSILVTRGPYNSVFLRKAEKNGAGFSIDQPLKTKTLLLNGLSMLKVETPFGNALVCLDARRGTGLSVVEHRGLDKKENLVCVNIDRLQPSKATYGSRVLRLPLKKSEDLQWKKVRGIYNDLEAVFV